MQHVVAIELHGKTGSRERRRARDEIVMIPFWLIYIKTTRSSTNISIFVICHWTNAALVSWQRIPWIWPAGHVRLTLSPWRWMKVREYIQLSPKNWHRVSAPCILESLNQHESSSFAVMQSKWKVVLAFQIGQKRWGGDRFIYFSLRTRL
jgi:hypothetical protein